MIEFTGNANDAVTRRAPAADGGVVLIVPDVPAVGVKDDPAELRVGQFGSALPGVTGPVRQRSEARHAPGGLVEPPIAVTPGAGRRRTFGPALLPRRPRGAGRRLRKGAGYALRRWRRT